VSGGKRLVGGGGGGGVTPNVGQPTWVDDLPEQDTIQRLRNEMNAAAARLEFERAATLRDRIIQLENETTN
jgi:excinuclease UvrABC helicase subunit UvrB